MITFTTLVLSLLMTGSISTAEETIEDKNLLEFRRSYNLDYSWYMACALTTYDCTVIEKPKVKYETLRPGLLGYYEGGDTVVLSRKLRKYEMRATMIHEIVHYLHVQTGKITVPGRAKPICWSENEAFRLTDIWWVAIGKPEKQRGSDWWKPYTHCWQYYAPVEYKIKRWL